MLRLLTCLAFLLPAAALAQAAPFDSLPLDCAATPALAGDAVKYPGAEKIVPSGNLIRPAGKAGDAPGQPVLLSGRVLDKDCVPVADAEITLWQTDSEGFYRYPEAGDLLSPQPVFAGAGRAVTDGSGEFHFSTIFPGPGKKSAPQLHLRVTAAGMDTLETTLYFAGDRRNDEDTALQKLSAADQAKLTAQVAAIPQPGGKSLLEAKIVLTLEGKNQFKRF